MSIVQPDKHRRLLPRWQPVSKAILHGELTPKTHSKSVVLDNSHFDARLIEWNKDPSLELAAELVSSGIVLGRTREIELHATQILDSKETILDPLRKMALSALGAGGVTDGEPTSKNNRTLDWPALYHRIGTLRSTLRLYPRSALTWVDLARLYTICGHISKANDALRIALSLNAEDRFVLRCASRFQIHIDQPDHALAILHRARATAFDPWLMAAEIATSQLIGRRSRAFLRSTRALDASAWTALSCSELRGAVATQYLYEGSESRAKKYFIRSLEDPTENAVAQAQWAAGTGLTLSIPQSAREVAEGFEANALHFRRQGEWGRVVEECWNWANYEPTSARPLMTGSYVALAAMGDAATSLGFSERGLYAEPRNPSLVNNRVVALAYLGRVSEATAQFDELDEGILRQIPRPIRLATAGLLLFRSGKPEDGRNKYEEALESSEGRADVNFRALALWHLAYEEACGKTEHLDRTLQRADEASKRSNIPELQAMRDRVTSRALVSSKS